MLQMTTLRYTARHSSSRRQPYFAALNRGVPSIFGRAAITLGIDPHSSLFLFAINAFEGCS